VKSDLDCILITYTIISIGLISPTFVNAAPPTPPVFDVNVTNTPSVSVGNPPTSPIPVKNVENPAKSPFWGFASGTFTADYINIQLSLGDIPEGKRLVIEQVTAYCELDSDDSIPRVTISMNHKTSESTYSVYQVPLLMQKMGSTYDGKVGWAISQQVRLYSDWVLSAPVTMDIRHSKTSSTPICFAVTSGYIVTP